VSLTDRPAVAAIGADEREEDDEGAEVARLACGIASKAKGTAKALSPDNSSARPLVKDLNIVSDKAASPTG